MHPHASLVLLSLALSAAQATAQCGDPLSIPRLRPAVVASGDHLFLAGGSLPPNYQLHSTRVDSYDVLTGVWSTDELSIGRSDLAAASVGGKVLFAGGRTSSVFFDRVDVLDVGSGAWNVDALSQNRAGAVGVSLGSRAYFAGGWTSPPVGPSDVVDVYDDSSGLWSVEALSIPRAWIGAAAVGQKVLFAGGMLASGGPTDVVDVYDAAAGSWSTATLSTPRFYVAAATVGSKVYLAGGQVTGASYSDVIDVYDDATGQWSTLELSTARICGAAVLGDRVLFSGGSDLQGNGMDVYDDARALWSYASFPPGAIGERGAVAGATAFFANLGAVYQFTAATIPTPFCFGDGSGTPCPCGNPGQRGAGCAHSTAEGAKLTLLGGECGAYDDVWLRCEDLRAGQIALPFVGLNATNGGAGFSFGDGLRCVGGSLARLPAGTAPESGTLTFGPGLAAVGGWGPGDLRRFQVWFRDPGGPCGSGFNTTNGVSMELGL